MPFYEYSCGSCDHQFETLQKISEPALTLCPQCENESLKKIVSKSAFKLTGTGWYETDFKEKPAKTKSKQEDVNKGNKIKNNEN